MLKDRKVLHEIDLIASDLDRSGYPDLAEEVDALGNEYVAGKVTAQKLRAGLEEVRTIVESDGNRTLKAEPASKKKEEEEEEKKKAEREARMRRARSRFALRNRFSRPASRLTLRERIEAKKKEKEERETRFRAFRQSRLRQWARDREQKKSTDNRRIVSRPSLSERLDTLEAKINRITRTEVRPSRFARTEVRPSRFARLNREDRLRRFSSLRSRETR